MTLPKIPDLTFERANELLSYDPDTGVIYWKARRHGTWSDIAGNGGSGRYTRIQIDGISYRAHRIAWLLMTGKWPKAFIDHRDMDKKNNKWENLREATKAQNCANQPPSKRGTSGYRGVSYYKAYGRWQAMVWKDRKNYFVGYFDTAEEANAARIEVAKKVHGEFARID